jgi:L-fuconolactonase
MLASNWPVVLLRAGYQAAWTHLSDSVERVLDDPNDLATVLGGTAAHLYRIN